MFTVINNVEYPLATTLRVAYEIQGQHNHKPYAEVFKGVGEMPVEQQIGMIYASYLCAARTAGSESIMTRNAFQDYYMDNFNLKDLMDQLQGIVQGIMGTDKPTEVVVEVVGGESTESTESVSTEDATTGEAQGN